MQKVSKKVSKNLLVSAYCFDTVKHYISLYVTINSHMTFIPTFFAGEANPLINFGYYYAF